jgi:4'-phosphopantetheinyl transferase EntD
MVSIAEQNHAILSGPISGLFSADARAAELYGRGDPAQLLPAEAAFLGRAVPKRAQEFAAGRMCARRALEEFGYHGVAVEMAADRQPIWPEHMVGSITHTAGYCAAVVARRDALAAIGLDSESSLGVDTHLWPSICLPAEIDWLNSLPESQRIPAATLIFSAKEAFYKCQYPLAQERLRFHDARVELREWNGQRGSFTIAATRSIAFAAHASLPMSGQYLFHEQFVTAGLCVRA